MAFAFSNSLCVCPPTNLVEVDNLVCPDYYYEAERVMFERVDAAVVLKTAVATLATWTARIALADTDPDKIVITPIKALSEFRPTGGEAVTVTTGNPNGVPQVISAGFTTWAGFFNGLTPAIIKQIRQLQCHRALRVWFINTNNQIIGYNESATEVRGFDMYPLTNFLTPFTVGDGGSGVFLKRNPFQLVLQDQYYDEAWFATNTNFATTLTV